jgi:hypothetical protein
VALGVALAQAPAVLTVASIPLTSARRGQVTTVEATAQLRSGYHVNSNTPSDAYLIPLKLTWDANLPVEVVEVSYQDGEVRVRRQAAVSVHGRL